MKQLEGLKFELQLTRATIPSRISICNVNIERGGWCMDSGSIGTSNVHNTALNDDQHTFVENAILLHLRLNIEIFNYLIIILLFQKRRSHKTK